MSLDATMDERRSSGPEPDAEALADLRRRRRRGRNIALLVALMAWVVIIYLVTIVRMGS